MTKTKPKLDEGGAIVWKGMEDEHYIPVAKLFDAQQAFEPGACGRCDKPYRKGDWLFRGSEEQLVAVNCCATRDDVRSDSLGDLDGAEDIQGSDFVSLDQVLPLRRTKADMCPVCFQIPASNGVCGC